MSKTVAILGAGADRRKFGNKSVRAHVAAGWTVYPVHPLETVVEGLPAFKSVTDIPVEHFDRVTVYLPPPVMLKVLPTLRAKSIGELMLNPGADTPDVVEAAKTLGLNVVCACSIVDVGFSPSQFGDA
ncbi:hypothetical protein BH11PLA2_BH11PLA2_50080 [soil metagenome]